MIVTNSLTGGGAERSMNLVCNELTKRGWPISLVPINFGPPDKVLPTCQVYPLGRRWKGGLMGTAYAFVKMKQILKSWKPEIIVLNCDLPEMFGALLFGNHQVVAVEHATNPWTNHLTLGKIVRKILVFRKVIWVAVSTHLTIWPSERAPSAVLRNPIIPIGENEGIPSINSISRLVYMGRLSPEKRPGLAIEIALKTNFGLSIIGDGYLREQLEHQALRDSLDVSFLGRVENPWLKVKSGDLLIVPSVFEGDGLVVLEGLQRDIPMLLTDIPDFRRFGFPEVNYCSSIANFVSRIDDFKDNLEALKIPNEVSHYLLRERDIEIIGTAWEAFLEQIA
jgi:glycosyltransferase involved in cell wall biosynthesis